MNSLPFEKKILEKIFEKNYGLRQNSFHLSMTMSTFWLLSNDFPRYHYHRLGHLMSLKDTVDNLTSLDWLLSVNTQLTVWSAVWVIVWVMKLSKFLGRFSPINELRWKIWKHFRKNSRQGNSL